MSDLFKNAVCLAPMVRAGTLPLRLVSLRYGADLVYSEEIIDKRIIGTQRIENTVLKTVDFVSTTGDSVVFRTCGEEKGKVVFQIGTADPQLALQAAKHVEKDVAAIDINMGCPKHFSIQGGMGAALLKNQEMACDIVRTLSSNLSIPVSAKIRLLETTEATIAFARALQDAGAAAIGLHARHVKERPSDKPHWDRLRPVVEALRVPVLVNGDIFTIDDIAKIREASGATSFLIARGAMRNASVFRKQGTMAPYLEVVAEYLKAAAQTDNVFPNTKFSMSRMLPSKCDDDIPAADAPVLISDLYATKSNPQMFALFGLADYYDTYQQEFQARAEELQATVPSHELLLPNHSYDDERVLAQQFFCNMCQLQLSSDKDVALHLDGKRHRNKLKLLRKAALEQVARTAATEAEAAAEAEVTQPQTETTQTQTEEVAPTETVAAATTRASTAEEPPAKRIKLSGDVQSGQSDQKEQEEQVQSQSPTEIATSN